MLASRVGVIGALVAVLVLSVELVGAVAVQHRIASDDQHESIDAAKRALDDGVTFRKGLGDTHVPNRAGY